MDSYLGKMMEQLRFIITCIQEFSLAMFQSTITCRFSLNNVQKNSDILFTNMWGYICIFQFKITPTFVDYMKSKHKNFKSIFDIQDFSTFPFLDVTITSGTKPFHALFFCKVTLSGLFTDSDIFKSDVCEIDLFNKLFFVLNFSRVWIIFILILRNSVEFPNVTITLPLPQMTVSRLIDCNKMVKNCIKKNL